ncbi:protein lava lamp-like [Lutzomyia longipalpis]|uniref:protein lava lamp-like n=1 Tax=Lutzomyia longipalpis TaxID=7200 RepID=UPI00248470C1|nr:protein lava lamp-like [Lutzomyia longipalpis]
MSTNEADSSSELSNLQENLSQQKAKIAALKELVRQSEAAQGRKTAHAKEKVKNIAQRLSHLKSKATNSGQVLESPIIEESQDVPPPRPISRSETPGSEKIQLLRRQMEENRQRMAERESSKRDIEEMVTQLKAKFDTTQLSLEKSTELGRSMGDLSILTQPSRPETPAHSAEAELRRKIRNLENEVEKYRENATQMPCNHTAEIQQLQHRILDLEENLREKESVIDARTQAVTLMSESLSQKTHSTVNMLEDTKVEMFRMQENFVEKEKQLCGEIEALKGQLEEKSLEIANLQEVNDILETTRYDLTVKNAELSAQGEKVTTYEAKIEELQEEVDRLHTLLPSDGTGQTAEEFLKHFRANEEKIHQLEESLMQKTVECSVLTANFSVLQEKMKATGPKPLFSSDRTEENDQEAAKLRAQLDEVNKGQIKMKLKMKQLQKQVESFRKMSDVHQSVLQLQEENARLREQISHASEAGELPIEGEASHELKTLQTTCQNQVAAIQLLEEQKIDLVDQVAKVREELDVLRTAPVRSEPMGISVSSQINSIELEETIEQYAADKESLVREVEDLIEKNEELKQKMSKFDEEKQELLGKLEQMSAEKHELLEKIDKLSIKNVSSVESLEIVENLTQQEQLEMEQQETGLIGEELSDSLMKLREESSELMNKIEVFTTERREIHQQYVEKIEDLEKQVKEAESERDELRGKTAELEDLLQTSRSNIENVENQLQLLRNEFSEKIDENHNLRDENETLREKLANMENLLTTLQAQGSDVQENVDRIAFLEQEILLKNETIDTVNQQIMDLYTSLEEKNTQLLDKDDEIAYLRDLHQAATDQLHQSTTSADGMKRLIDQLRRQLAEVEQKNARVANATDDVKIGLEKRIQELEDKVTDSEAKRREQLEKLKKFAANLKKKTQQCTDLEAEVIKRSEETDAVRRDLERIQETCEEISGEMTRMREIHETEKQELLQQLQLMQNEVDSRGRIIEELQASLAQPQEVEKWANIAKEKEMLVIQLQGEIANLHERFHDVDALKEDAEKVRKALEEAHRSYQENTTRAQEDFAAKEQRYQEMISSLEAKITEHLMYIEDKEIENASLSTRIIKLEEGISHIEARRNSLEKKNNILGDQLRQSQEEFTENEDKLLQRLATLSANDEIIAEKLQNTHAEKLELTEAIAELTEEKAALESRLQGLEQEQEDFRKRTEMHESEYNFLSQQIESQKAEMRKLQEDFERKLREKGQELDDLEVESSNQLQKIEGEKKSLNEALERVKDENSELQDEIMNLRENVNSLEQIRNDLERDYSWAKMQNETLTHDQLETQELRMQVVQDQTEIENLKQENKAMRLTHECEVNSLRSILDNLKIEKGKLEAEIEVLRKQAETRTEIQAAAFENPPQTHLATENLFGNAPEVQKTTDGLFGKSDAAIARQFSFENPDTPTRSALFERSAETQMGTVENLFGNPPVETNAQIFGEEKQEVDGAAGQNIPSFMGAKFFAADATAIDFFDQPADGVAEDDYENRTPVVEELIIPKTAYICHPKGEVEATRHVDLLGQEDDGWGWSAEEAVLEQEHQNQTAAPPSLLSQTSQVEVKLQMYEDRIHDLEVERESLREEIAQSRQKSEKMLRKLKEYRNKCESFERSSQSSLDLDLAIQEELKEQVRMLEGQLAAERKQLSAEMESLKKKVEVLCASNDRMVDMKEQQDAQVEMYRNHIKALNMQLQEMEKQQNDAWNRVDEEEHEGDQEKVADEVKHLQEEISQRDARISELSDKISQMEDEAEQFIGQIDQFRMESGQIRDHLAKLTQEHERLQVQDVERTSDTAKMEEMQKMIHELQEERSLLITELRGIREQANAAEKSADSLEMLKKELETLRKDKEALEVAAEEANRQWQVALEERGNAIAESWKAHLATVEAEYAAREEALREEFAQQTSPENLPEKLPEDSSKDLAPEHVPAGIAEMVANMQNALESQELELVTLKEQLAIRSAEYAALSAQLDPFGHSAMSNMALVQPKLIKTPPAPTGDPPRTDLDMALYTLHQRDMRCEELTLELTRLLEERDTLQLKLSSAIRQIESMKSSPDGSPVATINTSDAGSHLSEKISELQSVSHARDKNFHEERQQRHKQMSWFWSNT